MKFDSKMEYYQPIESNSMKQEHSVLYSFLFEDATAEIVSTVVGNVSGAAVMETDFSIGLTVPANHKLTKRHVQFYSDEDEGTENREVGSLIFYYPDGKRMTLDFEECEKYLVGIQIITYDPS